MSANPADDGTAPVEEFGIENLIHEGPADPKPDNPEPEKPEPNAEPQPEPEPAPAPEPTPDAVPEPEKVEPEPPVEPEPEPEPAAVAEPEPEPVPDAFAFDPATYGIGEKSMVAQRLAECTTEAEAFAALANEHGRLQATYGRHTQEVHDARTENERLQAELANRPTAPAAVGEPAAGVPPVQDASPNLNEWLVETWDKDPQAVVRYIAQATQQQVQQQVKKDQEATFAQHEQDRVLQADFLDLKKDHPDWEEHHDEMNEVARDVGFMPVYTECFDLTLLYEDKANAALYRGVRDLMKNGLPFAEAKEFHELRAGKTGVVKDAQEQAKKNAALRATKAATAAGGPARGTAAPTEPVTAMSIADLEDD